MCVATERNQNSKTDTLRFPSLQFSLSPHVRRRRRSSPPLAERPGRWLSGLVFGPGRLLAAVLGPESPDSASSSPESS